MDAAQARQLKIKTGALTRSLKDVTLYEKERDQQETKVANIRSEQSQLPAEEQEIGLVNRAEAELAETVAVIPTVVVKIENWLVELEGVMATIEDAQAGNMGDIVETDEWKASLAAITAARQFQGQE